MTASAFFRQQQVPANEQQQRFAAVTPAAKPAPAQEHNVGVPNDSFSSVSAGSTLARNWRFPSSRNYLWDRTACGQALVLRAQDYLPDVELLPSVLQSAEAATLKQPGSDLSINLLGTLTFPKGARARVLLRPASEQAGAGDAGNFLVACNVVPASGPAIVQVPAAAGAASPLRGSFRAALERRGPAQSAALCAVSCTLRLRNNTGNSHGGYGGAGGSSATAEGRVLLPDVSLSLLPLLSKRLCDVPLAMALSGPRTPGREQNGLLTMDQARSLLPLSADDPNVFMVPLVGVWVKGVSGLDDAAVMAACLRFSYSSNLPDRALQREGGAFLLLVFPAEGASVPACYEASFLAAPSSTSTTLPPPAHGAGVWAQPASSPAQGQGAALPLASYRFVAELLPGASAPAVATPVPDLAAGRQMLLLGSPHGKPRAGASGAGPPSSPPSPLVARARAAAAALSAQLRAGGVHRAAGPVLPGDDTQAVRDNRFFTSPSKAMKVSPREPWVGGGGAGAGAGWGGAGAGVDQDGMQGQGQGHAGRGTDHARWTGANTPYSAAAAGAASGQHWPWQAPASTYPAASQPTPSASQARPTSTSTSDSRTPLSYLRQSSDAPPMGATQATEARPRTPLEDSDLSPPPQPRAWMAPVPHRTVAAAPGAAHPYAAAGPGAGPPYAAAGAGAPASSHTAAPSFHQAHPPDHAMPVWQGQASQPGAGPTQDATDVGAGVGVSVGAAWEDAPAAPLSGRWTADPFLGGRDVPLPGRRTAAVVSSASASASAGGAGFPVPGWPLSRPAFAAAPAAHAYPSGVGVGASEGSWVGQDLAPGATPGAWARSNTASASHASIQAGGSHTASQAQAHMASAHAYTARSLAGDPNGDAHAAPASQWHRQVDGSGTDAARDSLSSWLARPQGAGSTVSSSTSRTHYEPAAGATHDPCLVRASVDASHQGAAGSGQGQREGAGQQAPAGPSSFSGAVPAAPGASTRAGPPFSKPSYASYGALSLGALQPLYNPLAAAGQGQGLGAPGLGQGQGLGAPGLGQGQGLGVPGPGQGFGAPGLGQGQGLAAAPDSAPAPPHAPGPGPAPASAAAPAGLSSRPLYATWQQPSQPAERSAASSHLPWQPSHTMALHASTSAAQAVPRAPERQAAPLGPESGALVAVGDDRSGSQDEVSALKAQVASLQAQLQALVAAVAQVVPPATRELLPLPAQLLLPPAEPLHDVGRAGAGEEAPGPTPWAAAAVQREREMQAGARPPGSGAGAGWGPPGAPAALQGRDLVQQRQRQQQHVSEPRASDHASGRAGQSGPDAHSVPASGASDPASGWAAQRASDVHSVPASGSRQAAGSRPPSVNWHTPSGSRSVSELGPVDSFQGTISEHGTTSLFTPPASEGDGGRAEFDDGSEAAAPGFGNDGGGPGSRAAGLPPHVQEEQQYGDEQQYGHEQQYGQRQGHERQHMQQHGQERAGPLPVSQSEKGYGDASDSSPEGIPAQPTGVEAGSGAAATGDLRGAQPERETASSLVARAAEIMASAWKASGRAPLAGASLGAAPGSAWRSTLGASNRGGSGAAGAMDSAFLPAGAASLAPRRLWASGGSVRGGAEPPGSPASGAVRTPSVGTSRGGARRGLTRQRRVAMGLSDDEEDGDAGDEGEDSDQEALLDEDSPPEDALNDASRPLDASDMRATSHRATLMRMSFDRGGTPMHGPANTTATANSGTARSHAYGDTGNNGAAAGYPSTVGGAGLAQASVSIIRTRCVDMEDDGNASDSSDSDSALMLKYGIRL